ncbi:MAG: 30S ribosomal protein S6 [Mycoplasma sp.]|nr:30S ribosomal protein S6 [Mycoplasma sp.]
MAKYEIMLVLDPKADQAIAKNLLTEVFGKEVKIKKLENTDLAYEINKSMTGIFLLIKLETESSNIKEWNRKVNINKSIWRNLVINLDNESTYGKKYTEKKFSKYPRLRIKQAERQSMIEARKAERAARENSKSSTSQSKPTKEK